MALNILVDLKKCGTERVKDIALLYRRVNNSAISPYSQFVIVGFNVPLDTFQRSSQPVT